MSRVEQIMEAMREATLYGDVYEEEDDVVAVEIRWGDWKHSHLRLSALIGERFKPVSYEQVVTEDDGSDCYSAIHRFRFS